MDIIAVLNQFNGSAEIGVAAGADPALSENRKLVIPSTSKDEAVILKTMVSNFDWSGISNTVCKSLVMAGMVAILKYGLIDADSNDIVQTDVAPSDDTKVSVPVTPEDIHHAATMVAATKLNYFAMNHHVGQGVLAGFPAKVAKLFYNVADADSRELYTSIHMVGHWASTHLTLRKLGFSSVLDVTPYVEGHDFAVAEDIKLRLTGHPAGTAKAYVAHASLKRLIHSGLTAFTPNLRGMAVIVREYNKIQANPVAYHIGAKFLTGADRLLFDEASVTGCLGRLGTFVCTLFPNSTLAKSPLYRRGKERIYDSYDDYSEVYSNTCQSYREAVSNAMTRSLGDLIKGDILQDDDAVIEILDLFTGKEESEPEPVPQPIEPPVVKPAQKKSKAAHPTAPKTPRITRAGTSKPS